MKGLESNEWLYVEVSAIVYAVAFNKDTDERCTQKFSLFYEDVQQGRDT